MTRVLVYGSTDDYAFVHQTLTDVDKVYGPISCVIHSNHPHALAWQQWVMRRQVTRHLPIVEDWKRDDVAASDRCLNRLFNEGRPNYVVAFETPANEADTRGRLTAAERSKRSRLERVIFRAKALGIEVLKYTNQPARPQKVRAA